MARKGVGNSSLAWVDELIETVIKGCLVYYYEQNVIFSTGQKGPVTVQTDKALYE